MNDGQSYVYLIHFKKPFKHASHYLGATRHFDARIASHRANHGAKLLKAVNQAGIEWEVVRVWDGGWNLEKYLKARKHSQRLCPVCTPDLVFKTKRRPRMTGAHERTG